MCELLSKRFQLHETFSFSKCIFSQAEIKWKKDCYGLALNIIRPIGGRPTEVFLQFRISPNWWCITDSWHLMQEIESSSLDVGIWVEIICWRKRKISRQKSECLGQRYTYKISTENSSPNSWFYQQFFRAYTYLHLSLIFEALIYFYLSTVIYY